MMEQAMLSEQELLCIFVQQAIPLSGRKVVESIRISAPTRRTGGGTHNVAARFASRKMGVVIQAESHKNELPALYLWEHDPATYEFYDQPPQVKLSYRNSVGKTSTHLSTPDFFIIQDAWVGWVECKTEESLLAAHASGNERFQPDGSGGWRCPAGEAYAAQFGIGFKVRSSKETNWILVRNLEFLSDYFRASCPAPPDSETRRVLDIFATERWMFLSDLLLHEGVVADVVYKLIADDVLHVSLEDELLSERNYTTVCRDAESAEIYLSQKRGRVSLPAVVSQAIELAPQTRIAWDSKPWTLANVGTDEICLLSDDREVVNLEHGVFRSLVARGQIVGLPERDERELLAERLVKQAAVIDLQQAARRSACLDAAAAGEGAGKVPARTLRYWRMRAAQGVSAVGNRFVGLLPRISSRGNRNRKLPREVIDIMNRVIDDQVLTSTQANTFACYGAVVNICRERGLICPSEKSFRKEIGKRRLDLRILARQGRKAAYPVTEYYWTIDQSTPRHGERPFEVGHIDHTELDVELVDAETGANLGRPWLTILLDASTRMVLAFFLTFDPPSYRSCMAVIRECVRRHGRIPATIVVDQGSEFESTYFEALLARFQSHKKSRPAAKSRFGSPIERFFGVSNQTFIHNLIGNSQALQKPRSMSPSHDPRKLAVWTLGALTDLFDRYVEEHYGQWRHTALGMSPKEAMARGLAAAGHRAHLLIPYTEEFRFQCLPSTAHGKARVRPGKGISIRKIDYWHPAFRDLGDTTSVPVRYDPFNVSRAYALVQGTWLECRSHYQAQLERRTEREIAIISQEICALHAQRSIHRQTKAADIAAFLDIAHASEAVLRQQRRDAQHAMSRSAPAIQPSQLPATTNDRRDDPWSDAVDLEVFGDLK
jgi:putative transposase